MKRIIALSIRFFVVLITVGVFAQSAYGQMGYTYNYTTASADYSGGYVHGCGVTYGDYNTYGHTYSANTTVTSPEGRQASFGTGFTSGPAVADVFLEFEEEDGDFLINTEHEEYCPVVQSIIFIGTSTALQGVRPWVRLISFIVIGLKVITPGRSTGLQAQVSASRRAAGSSVEVEVNDDASEGTVIDYLLTPAGGIISKAVSRGRNFYDFSLTNNSSMNNGKIKFNAHISAKPDTIDVHPPILAITDWIELRP